MNFQSQVVIGVFRSDTAPGRMLQQAEMCIRDSRKASARLLPGILQIFSDN